MQYPDLDMSEIFQSDYLSAELLVERKGLDKDQQLTIKGVLMEDVWNPRTKTEELKPVLEFVGTDKRLVVIKTNAVVLVDLFGPKTLDWQNRTIRLYATMVKAFGKLQPGIRVRHWTQVEGKAVGKDIDEEAEAVEIDETGKPLQDAVDEETGERLFSWRGKVYSSGALIMAVKEIKKLPNRDDAQQAFLVAADKWLVDVGGEEEIAEEDLPF